MLKKLGSLMLGMTIMTNSLLCVGNISASAEESAVNSYDSEYVMWTDEKIVEGFYAMSPNESNKESSGVQSPYNNEGDIYDKWSYYEFLWTHGYPVGNGRMAAMVMGGLDKEVIQINEDTVWNGSPYVDSEGNSTAGSVKDTWKYYRGATEDGEPAPFGSKDVLTGTEEFREQYPEFANKTIANMALDIDNGESQEAVEHRLDLINFTDNTFLGNPVKQRAYQSFVELYLDFGHDNDGAENYTKRLDMRNAVVTVDYDYDNAHYTRETFASYPDQAIVTNVKSSGKELDFTAQLHTWLEGSQYFEKISDNEIKIVASPKDLKNETEPGWESKIKGEARMYITGDGASFSVSEDNSTITVRGGNEATIYIVGATNYVDYLTLDDNKPAADCEKYMSKIKGRTYEEIKADHEKDYKELFDRSSLTLENNNGVDESGTPTEQRIRKNLENGESGYSVGSGNSLSSSTPVDSTYNDGDNKLVTMLFNYGKYLMIAGSRDADEENGIPMSQPLNLTGKWNSTTSPSWAGKYTVNINTEMNYWPSQVLNLSECIMPLKDMLFDLAENGSVTAKYQYGVENERGDDVYQPGDPWVMHNNTDLWRGTQFVDNAGVLWPMGGAWLMDSVWKYYQYNLDNEYLAEIYPIMKGLSSFYTQFLVLDPQTGYLITAASSSPEQGSIQPGSAIDTQLIRNLYDMTIKSAEILGKTEEDADLIATMKEQMPENGYFSDEQGKIAPDRIDDGGYIMEWARGDVQFDFADADESNALWTYIDPFSGETSMHRKHDASNISGHRHTSHLWELFPGTHLNAYSEDSRERELYQAFQKTVRAKGAGSGQGWGIAWRIALSARAHDGETADSRLEQLIRLRLSPNMFDQHPNFQIDGNYGSTAGIAEMLMQNQGDTVEILPAISSKWDSGEFSGFKAIGNIEVGAKRQDDKTQSVTVKTAQDREVKIRCADFNDCAVVVDEDRNIVDCYTESEGTVVAFNAVADKTYTIYTAQLEPDYEEVTWVKGEGDVDEAVEYVSNSSGNKPKYYENDTDGNYWGGLTNDNTSMGFAVDNCQLDNLSKLGVKLAVYNLAVNGNGTVTVHLGAKDGPVLGSAQLYSAKTNRAFEWLEIPLSEDLDPSLLNGNARLYFMFRTDVSPETTKYICNVQAVSGTLKNPIEDDSIVHMELNGQTYTNSALINGTYTAVVDDAVQSGVENAKLIFALYDNGTMIDSQAIDITNESRTGEFTVSGANDNTVLKVMLWNNLEEMQPLSEVKELGEDIPAVSPPSSPIPDPTAPPATSPSASPTPDPTAAPTASPVPDDNKVTVVTAAGETFDFETISDAVAKVAEINPQSEEQRVYIDIAPGVYREQVILDTPYVTMRKKADESGTVTITWYYGLGSLYDSCNSSGYYDSSVIGDGEAYAPSDWGAALKIGRNANDFIAENLLIENSYNRYYTQEELTDILKVDPSEGNGNFERVRWIQDQLAAGKSDDDINAVLRSRTGISGYGQDGSGNASSPRERCAALHCSADRSQFINCEIISTQDTMGINTGRMYFKNCKIGGTTDYICGNSPAAVFDNCELYTNAGNDGDDATITAPSNPENTNGYLFYNCHITGSPFAGDGSSLGRPWSGVNASANYINTKIDNASESQNCLIKADGWSDMGENKATEAKFSEYGSVDEDGKAIEISSDLRKSKTLDEWTMLRYNPLAFLQGDDGWDPAEMTEKYTDVNNVLNTTVIDTSGLSDTITLPSAPNGYEFKWESCSEFATVNGDKATLVRPAYGEAAIEAAVKLYVRKSDNKEIGAEKTIEFMIEPTQDVENVFTVRGAANLSVASDKEQVITIRFMKGDAIIKSEDVTIPAGETSVQYTVENIPLGTYTVSVSTMDSDYNIEDSQTILTGTNGETKEFNITARKMSVITIGTADFTDVNFQINEADGFSAGVYTPTGTETANLEKDNKVYKLTKDDGKTVSTSTGFSLDLSSMLKDGTSFKNTNILRFSFDFLVETADYLPKDYSFFDLTTTTQNAGEHRADDSRFLRWGVFGGWQQLDIITTNNSLLRYGYGTRFVKDNMANRWITVVADINLEAKTIIATFYDRDDGQKLIGKEEDVTKGGTDYPSNTDLSHLYFNFYMDKDYGGFTEHKLEYYIDNISVEYQDFD